MVCWFSTKLSFSFMFYVYTVCHVDHYIKVHQVQIKFWLIMANSASDHSIRHPPFVLVMTYSLTTQKIGLLCKTP